MIRSKLSEVKMHRNIFVYECVNGRDYKVIHSHRIHRPRQLVGEYGEDIVCLSYPDYAKTIHPNLWSAAGDEMVVFGHRAGGNKRIVLFPKSDIIDRLNPLTNHVDFSCTLVLSKIVILVWQSADNTSNGNMNRVRIWKDLQSHYFMYEMQENLWSFRMVYVRTLYTEHHREIYSTWLNVVRRKPSWVWDTNGDFIFVSHLQNTRNQIGHFRFLKEQNFTEYIVSWLQISTYKIQKIRPISAQLMAVPHTHDVNGLYIINQLYCRDRTNKLSNYSLAVDRRQNFVFEIDANFKLFLDNHDRLIAWPMKAKSSLAKILQPSL
jgi:hypothetical protein